MYYIGIDIAKFKHDCFIADENGHVIKPSFSFQNDNNGFYTLLEILNDLKSKGQIKIGFESTGHYHYLLNKKGFLNSRENFREPHTMFIKILLQ